MIKAVIFDLDNTLIDFMYMKNQAVDSAINGMIESGLNISHEEAKKAIFKIYDKRGYEYQEVLNKFILSSCKNINYKILAAGIVSYRRAKEKSLMPYPHTAETLIEISKLPWSQNMADAASEKSEPILTFEGKRYELSTLPEEIKELVRGMQVADAQLRMHEDTLKVLAVGRQSMANQLNEKLRNIKSL